ITAENRNIFYDERFPLYAEKQNCHRPHWKTVSNRQQHLVTATASRYWKLANGLIPWITSSQRAAQSALDAFCSSFSCMPVGPPESTFRSPRPLLIRTPFPRVSRHHFPEVRKWNAALRALCAGTPWQWSSVLIVWKAGSAATFLPMPPPRRYMKWPSIIS